MAYVLPPELQSLLAYWTVHCNERAMPDRRALRLRDMAAWYDLDIAAYGDLRRHEFAFTLVTYCDLVLPLSDGGGRASQLLMGSYAVAHHANS